MANLFGYLTRTAEQIEQQLKLVVPIELPEITDLEQDILVRSFKIWAHIHELAHYYIEQAARESNPSTAELFSSLVNHARSVDYRVKSVKPCEVEITFTISQTHTSDIIIPKGTEIETKENIIYTTNQNAIILAGTLSAKTDATQIQTIENELIGVSSGVANQVLVMSSDIVDNSIVLKINSEIYEPKNTFYDSLPNSLHFIQTINASTNNDIILGDGVHGKLPTANQNIFADYKKSIGKEGKVGKNTLTKIINLPTLPSGIELEANNELESFGGEDFENIEVLRKNIARFTQTIDRAVSREMYIALAELYQGVGKAGLFYESGTKVEIFIVPQGGGLASPTFLAEIQNYMQNKIIICTQVEVKSAGQIDVLIDLEVNLLSNAIKNDVRNNILEALENFGSFDIQEIGGEMSVGSLNQIVCNITGVETCTLNNFNIRPYSRPVNLTQELNWEVEMLENSITLRNWRIIFISTSSFNLFRDSIFLGTFAVGNEVIKDEVKFTILQNYSTGNEFRFLTYKYLGNKSGKYKLEEPAILRIMRNNVNLTLIGGL